MVSARRHFGKKKNKILLYDELKAFIFSRISRNRWMAVGNAVEWGVRNGMRDRALRTTQELCVAGYFRRMTEKEKEVTVEEETSF